LKSRKKNRRDAGPGGQNNRPAKNIPAPVLTPAPATPNRPRPLPTPMANSKARLRPNRPRQLPRSRPAQTPKPATMAPHSLPVRPGICHAKALSCPLLRVKQNPNARAGGHAARVSVLIKACFVLSPCPGLDPGHKRLIRLSGLRNAAVRAFFVQFVCWALRRMVCGAGAKRQGLWPEKYLC